MPPMPVEADAPPDLVTPLHRQRGGFRLMGAALEFRRRRHGAGRADRDRGNRARTAPGSASPTYLSSGATRAIATARSASVCDAVAADVVGGDHRLAPSDQHAQADIVAFGALGFLDAAVADLDALRNAAHRDRVGGIGAGALGGLDQALRQCAKRRLIEQVGGRRFLRKREAADGEEFTNKFPEIGGDGTKVRPTHQMCLIHCNFKQGLISSRLQRGIPDNFALRRKVSSIMRAKVLSIMMGG